MTVMLTLDVIVRGLFNRSLGWLSEVPVYLNIVVPYLAAAYVMRKQKHIIVEVVVERVSDDIRQLFRFFTLIVSWLFFLVLIWKGTAVTLTSYNLGNLSYNSLSLPMYIPQSVLPIGAALLALEGLVQIARAGIGLRASFHNLHLASMRPEAVRKTAP